MRISDWSSDVCSSDLQLLPQQGRPAVRGVDPPARLDAAFPAEVVEASLRDIGDAGAGQRDLRRDVRRRASGFDGAAWTGQDRCRCGGKDKRQCHDDYPSSGATRRSEKRSEEHTSELQSLMRISYAVFCLKKKK